MPKESTANYRALRVGLMHRGGTLRAWALKHRFPVGSVYKAASGQRHGRQSREIVRRLEAALRD